MSCTIDSSVFSVLWRNFLSMNALQSAEWRDLLRRVKTCAELLHCVTTLLTRGVDWTCARQLFPRINGHSGKNFSCSESYLLSADGLLRVKEL